MRSTRRELRRTHLLAFAVLVLLWLQPFVDGGPRLMLMGVIAGAWMWRSATWPCPDCGRPVNERTVAGLQVHGAGAPRHRPHCGHDLEETIDG